MSTETKTAPAKATNGQPKKAQVRVSAKDKAKQGNKGILKVLVSAAFAIGKDNKFKGTQIENAETPQHSVVYSVTKEGGKIDKIDEKGDMYKNFLAKGKAALGPVSEGQYTDAVQKFIDGVFELRIPSESKSAILKGVKFV